MRRSYREQPLHAVGTHVAAAPPRDDLTTLHDARDVLAVADNMHRALEAIGPELRESGDAKVKALIEGVELTERELLKTLEKNGVKKFSPQGEKFDPNVHQAMYEIPTSELPRPRWPKSSRPAT